MQAGWRRNIRLPQYDYSESGIYYVTITLKERRSLFGVVTNRGVELSPAGVMITRLWASLPERFQWATVDDFVVMPDHMHGILAFGTDPDQYDRIELGTVIGGFKSLTTLEYGKGVRESGWSPYQGKLWLENYCERVVRNDRELDQIRNYILGNPYRWLDKHGK